MAEIKMYGRTEACTYPCESLDSLFDWLDGKKVIGLDTETNMVESILNRQLKVISMSDMNGDINWFVDWEHLHPVAQARLARSIKTKHCIIQNVSFDYAVFLHCTGVMLEKVYDTMLAEQVIFNGYSVEKGYFGLQGIYKRRFDIDISKDEQTTFSVGPYNDGQIQYACIDTLKLGSIQRVESSEIRKIDERIAQKGNKGLKKTLWWENEFVKAVADMEMTGVRIVRDEWYKIEEGVRPIYDEELHKLNEVVVSSFWDVLEANGWISSKDEFTANVWTSAAKKKALLDHIYTFEIEKSSKVELKKVLMEHDPNFPEGLKLSGKAWESSEYPVSFTDNFAVIKLMILVGKDNKDEIHRVLNNFLLENCKDFIIDQGWLRPAGQLSLNWASPIQRLKIFQAIDPSIESTGKDILEDYIGAHDIIPHYLQWAEVSHQIKSFGKPFYDKHVEVDGKHRTRFNQILATGRLSSVKPNLLNVPSKTIYRNCFVPDKGFVDVGADYDGEELVITATLAGEKAWLDTFEKGYDLHSVNASLIYTDAWDAATEEGCAFEELDENGVKKQQKCKCKGHGGMRDDGKTIVFGSLYGLSAISLAFRLKITRREAQNLLDAFFAGLPAIDTMMKKVQNFAVTNGYIIEPVFGRIRFYDRWKLTNQQEIGGIERTAGNYIIQASGSAVLKIACVLLRRWINHSNNRNNIQMKLPVHDELYVQARPEYVELAKEKVAYYMELAGKLAGFKLNAESVAGKSWGECH